MDSPPIADPTGEPTPPSSDSKPHLLSLEEEILAYAETYQDLPWLAAGSLSLLGWIFVDIGGRHIQAQGFSPFVQANWGLALAIFLGGAILRVRFTYLFAKKLKVDTPIVPALLSFFDCVNLLVLIWMDEHAMERLNRWGVKVGFGRISRSEMERLRRETANEPVRG